MPAERIFGSAPRPRCPGPRDWSSRAGELQSSGIEAGNRAAVAVSAWQALAPDYFAPFIEVQAAEARVVLDAPEAFLQTGQASLVTLALTHLAPVRRGLFAFASK